MSTIDFKFEGKKVCALCGRTYEYNGYFVCDKCYKKIIIPYKYSKTNYLGESKKAFQCGDIT